MANPRESQAAVSSTTNSSSRPVDQPVNDARICRIVDYCLWGLLFVCGVVVVITCQLYFMGRYSSSPKFQISSFLVSPFNTSSFPSALLDSDWKITFLVRNPTGWNPTPTSYGQFEVSLLYRGVPISSASVSPFHLHVEEEGVVGASMAILPVDNNVVISNIYYDVSKDGTVNFTVAVNGTIRWLKLGPFKGDWHDMTVSCNNVMVGFYVNNGGAMVGGALVGGPAKCKAHVKIGFWEFP